MPEPQDRSYLEDILNAIRRAEASVAGMNYFEYLQSNEAHDAILLALENIEEAAEQLSAAFRDEQSEVAWRSLVGLRDRPMDSYFGINLDTLWRIVVDELPGVRRAIGAMLSDMGQA